jgi:hypothetical protein
MQYLDTVLLSLAGASQTFAGGRCLIRSFFENIKSSHLTERQTCQIVSPSPGFQIRPRDGPQPFQQALPLHRIRKSHTLIARSYAY